ncbi:MAG: phosphate regulon transcriptional regulatory protein PhoB [Rhodospirillaceae bacterium]|nr:phosphate regulon transcriptional regulatory protein PhoB [Rhodospirillaceae bacterium]
MKPKVLIAEDEAPLVELLTYNLEKASFHAQIARDGEEALLAVEEHRPDLVLLDWMLPYVSGVEICRRIRRNPETHHVPIILLTARGEEDDRIRGLDAGADDYVVKPFSPSELIARARAVLRRTRPAFGKDLLTFGDIAMDLVGQRVSRSDTPVDLSATGFRLLRFLMEHPGRVFSREQLLDSVWGHDTYIEPRTVDVHILRLRKALNLPGTDDPIRTVRSAGYALELKNQLA